MVLPEDAGSGVVPLQHANAASLLNLARSQARWMMMACRPAHGDLTTMLAECFPENPLTILHRVWAVTAQAPPS